MSHLRPVDPSASRSALRRRLALVLGAVASSVLLTAGLSVALPSPGTRSVLARSAGVTSYLLLVALVLSGYLLSHPWATRLPRPHAAVRIRVHVVLAATALGFTVVHVVMWATTRDGGVGWWGALVPWGSSFRPLHVSLGVLGVYAGLLAGVTAALAGRLPVRVWWSVHKVALVSLALVWVHTLGGLDVDVLLALYVATGLLVVALGVSRHLALHHRHRVPELARVEARVLPGAAAAGDVDADADASGTALRR